METFFFEDCHNYFTEIQFFDEDFVYRFNLNFCFLKYYLLNIMVDLKNFYQIYCHTFKQNQKSLVNFQYYHFFYYHMLYYFPKNHQIIKKKMNLNLLKYLFFTFKIHF